MITHRTLVRQLSSFSRTLFYKNIILNIHAKLSRAPASQELSVGILPLKKNRPFTREDIRNIHPFIRAPQAYTERESTSCFSHGE